MKFEIIDSAMGNHLFIDGLHFYEVYEEGRCTTVVVKRELEWIEEVARFFNPIGVFAIPEDESTTQAPRFWVLPPGYRCERCGHVRKELLRFSYIPTEKRTK